MRLLLHDSLATLPLVEPLRAGWVDTAGIDVVFDSDLGAGRVGSEDIALIPVGELTMLAGRFQVVPDIGVIADGAGSVSLRVPVRPDEIDVTSVRLLDVGSTAEILARAVLRPYFGIEASRWSREPDPDAQAVVIEGEAALAEPEGGFAEDLCRAWFIMTGQAVVLHVLIAPIGMERSVIDPVLQLLTAAQKIDKSQRREMRRPIAERVGMTTEQINAFFERLFFSLEADDLDSLEQMLRRGVPGSAYPAPGPLTFMSSPLTAVADEDDEGDGFVADDEEWPEGVDRPGAHADDDAEADDLNGADPPK